MYKHFVLAKLPNLKLFRHVYLVALVFGCSVFSCRTESEAAAGEVVEDLNAPVFKKQLRKEKGILIDVRTFEEYMEAHITGALNLDISGDNFKSEINKLDKKKVYFIYCSDERSKTAADYMREIGFRKIYNLEGGIAEWIKRKLPITVKENKGN